MTVGTRAQVWHDTADRTSGGLTKTDLFMKNGRIRSRRASRSAKKNQNLKNAGWTYKKGEFGAIRTGDPEEGVVTKKKTKKKSAKGKAKGKSKVGGGSRRTRRRSKRR
jgi:hypothetical protein